MVTFTAPQNLKNNKFLVIGTNTWMSKQGLRRPLRISGNQKLFGDAGVGATVGIDYYHDYQVQEFKQETENYSLELVAKDQKTAYQQISLKISKENYLLQESILKSVNGTPLKKLNYHDYQQIGKHYLADITIKNLLQNQDRVTELKYLDIKDKDLEAKAFQPLMMGQFDLLIKD
jgi:hypothetical protein